MTDSEKKDFYVDAQCEYGFEETPYGQAFINSKQQYHAECALSPYNQMYFEAIQCPPVPVCPSSASSHSRLESQKPTVYKEFFEQALSTPPVYPFDSKTVAAPIVLQRAFVPKEEPGVFEVKAEVSTQVAKPVRKKNYGVLFIVALLSLAGVMTIFLGNSISIFDIGINVFDIKAIPSLGYQVYALIVLYALMMQLCFVLAVIAIFSNENPWFGWFALAGVILALVYSVVKLDLIFNFDLAAISGQYGLMILIGIPLIILLLRPFCIKKKAA